MNSKSYTKTVGYFKSANGITDIKYYVYTPVTKPVAAIQIVHGMCEFTERYEELAEFMCKNSIAVYGNDHIGHGSSVKTNDELGYFFTPNGWKDMIADTRRMLLIGKERFGELPTIMFGHSMGSFVARACMVKFPELIDGTNIRFCNTEWLPLNGADVYNMVPRSELKHNKCFLFSKWSYALDAAAILMMWQRYGQSIDFINFNNWANTHAQSVIETPKEGAFVAASGMMLHRFAHTEAYQTLQMEDYHPTRTDPVQVQLSVNADGSALVLNILNRSEEDGEVELDLTAFDVPDGEARGVLLAGDELLSMNKLGDQQITEREASVSVANRIVKTVAQKLSYAEYVIPLGK